jgi:hypothetical protein
VNNKWKIKCQVSLLAVSLASLFVFFPKTALGATYTINSPETDTDGACTNPYIDTANDCTIREAITTANDNAGADIVVFNIDASFQADPAYYNNSQYTITPTTVLPDITGQTTITARASWDVTNDRPGIKLYSALTTFNALIFSAGAANSLITSLEIQGFSYAIYLSSSTTTIGTDCDGSNDTQERNVIHGGANGIYMTGSSNIIAGNWLGLDDDNSYSGYSGNGIYITGTTADTNVIGFREGVATCTSAVQRNVIATGTTSSSNAISLAGTSNNVSGNSAVAPDHNIIAGNYIGTDNTGTANRGSGGVGLRLAKAATLNFIGTDGDGIDDEFEGNVIVAPLTGITFYGTSDFTITGNNRIAGNYIGVKAVTGNAIIDNTTMTVGVIIHGVGNIVGWCDSSDHATLCSDAGTGATQRNIIGGASSDQIRFGALANANYIYGNYIGVGLDGASDISLAIGAFIHRASTNNKLGGNGNRANTIKYNTIGVKLDGDYTGSRTSGGIQTPITNTTVTNNTVANNDTYGIQAYWTENFGASSITVSNNTMQNNGSAGFDIIGSSPAVTNNIISNNGTYGIQVSPGFIKRNVPDWNANEAATSYDPANAATNILSAPTITGNTVTNNNSGGIYQLDDRSSNYATLFADNTISNNNSQFAIKQSWYGAIELLDKNNSPIPAAAWSDTTAIAGTNSSAAAVTAGGDDMIFGSIGIAYTDVTSWFTITDYTINDAGVTTNFNPYTITATGTYTNHTGVAYTFDGSDNDTTYSGVLANGITTDSLYRFQIAKGVSSTVPSTPSNVTPTADTTTATLTPTLTTSTFSDTTETHASTTWQIYSTTALCAANGTGDVYSTTSSTALTSLTLSNNLISDTTYYWHAAYTNSYGNTSNYSTCTAFTTFNTTPRLINNIPDISWNEDETLLQGLNLASYFVDVQNQTLTYGLDLSDPEHITITNNDNELTFSATTNWYGTATLDITACDTDNECVSANTITLTVNSVNDLPIAPASDFSPNNATVATLTPTINWANGTDTEDSAEQLYYDVWLSTQINASNDPIQQLTSTVGQNTLTISTSLLDKITYYYIVRTIDSAGAASDWSDVQRFSIDVEKQPAFTITKNLQIITSDLTPLAAIVNSDLWSKIKLVIQQFSLAALLVCAGTVLTALANLWRKLPTLQQIAVVLLKQPALAFASLVNQDQNGNYKSSYTSFSQQIIPWRRVLQYSIAGLMLFVSLNFTAHTLATQVDVSAVAPGDTIRYTVTYKNTGTGAATAVTLNDALPTDTTLLADSITLNRSTSNLTPTVTSISNISLNTVNSNESGTLQYQATVNNPVTNTNLTTPAASLTTTDLSTTTTSNTTNTPITAASLNITLRTDTFIPITNATLNLFNDTISDANLVWTGTTNEQGMASTTGFRAGSYWLSVTNSSYNINPQLVNLNYQTITSVLLVFSTTIPEEQTTNTNLIKNTNTSYVNTNVNTVVNQTKNNNSTNQQNNPLPIPITELNNDSDQFITNTTKKIITAVTDIINQPIGKLLTHAVQVIGLAVWPIAIGSQLLLATTAVTSLTDLYLLIARFIGAVFGLRKKRQPWGTVYDAITKRPLDPAYVTIKTKSGKTVKESITDLDGRYEFFLDAGSYKIAAIKTHYHFPSKQLNGQFKDELYNNLYYGELFSTTTNEVITRNIPLDPIDFDWNEFEKNKKHQFKFYSRRKFIINLISYTAYGIGFAISLLLMLIQRSWFNIIIFIIYLLLIIYQLFWLPKRRAAVIKFSNGQPLSFAILRVYSARLQREMKSTVTDAYGRFYLLLSPGNYYWTVTEKLADGTYKQIYQSKPIHLKTGVLPKKIIIDK